MISHLPPQNNVQRPGSAHNSVSYGYEPTPSPIGYLFIIYLFSFNEKRKEI